VTNPPIQIDAGRARVMLQEALLLADETPDLQGDAVLAATLRRAASFSSPAGRSALVGEVVAAIGALLGDRDQLRDRVTGVLDRLLDHGDLLELAKAEAGQGRRILLRPPAYVETASSYLLLGVRPEGAPIIDLLSDRGRIEEGVVRRIDGKSETIREALEDAGLQALTAEAWAGAPSEVAPEDLLAEIRAALLAAGPVGKIEGLRVIDPESKLRFYKGRFREPIPRDSGMFVARRPQAFGPERWCIASISAGVLEKLIDFPIMGGLERPGDEALRAQAAIDTVKGHPQHLGVRDREGGKTSLDFFAPLPSWATRRLDSLGGQVEQGPGALFSYRLGDGEAHAETRFLASYLWLERTPLN
jgi:hypothetical protein